MGVMEGTDRSQAGFWSLDELVGEESMVRVIDRFIDITDLNALGFLHMEPAATGRPRYATPALAKLYVCGYENGIRSSQSVCFASGKLSLLAPLRSRFLITLALEARPVA